MTINEPDMLVSFEAVSFPYGQDVDTHQLAVQRAPNLADAPIYALKLGDSPLHLISAADARRLTDTLAVDLKDSGVIPTFDTDKEN